MGLEFINKLPTPEEIREQFPLTGWRKSRQSEMKKSERFCLERVRNFWLSSVPVPQITKTLSWIM